MKTQMNLHKVCKGCLGTLILFGLMFLFSACSSGLQNKDLVLEKEAIVKDLLVSSSANHSGSKVLDTTAVKGNIYVFTAETSGIMQVSFYLDDPQRSGNPKTEGAAPFDFAGGSSTVANPFDSSSLTDGVHVITAAISYSDGRSKVVSATFLVDNSGNLSNNLLVSKTPSRTDATLLENSTLSGNVYVFLVPSSSVNQVAFYFDDPDRKGTPRQVERAAMYDFAGTASSGESSAFAVDKLSEGTHTITAVLSVSGGQQVVTSGTFTFQNTAVAPSPDPVPESINYKGPITITSGGTYSGNWESTNPDVAAVMIKTSESVVIENSNLRGRGTLIHAAGGYNVNLTVRNVRGYGLNPNVVGKYPGRFLFANTYSRVIVENSYMEGTSGMNFYMSKPGATVKILRNEARNIDGRKSDGNGGWQTDFYRVQFVQFNQGLGLIDTEIAWNMVINEPYVSRPEDVISLFKTSGTASSPVRIHDNYIQGAYPADPARDGFSGGGIILGDAGGAYLHAFRNQVVSTSNYGIAIAGGQHNRISDNRVVSCGYLKDGTYIKSQNTGLYIWNFEADPNFTDNSGSGNLSGWVRKGYTGDRNDWWVPNASSWTDNIHWGGSVTCQSEVDEIHIWQNKLASNSVTVGTR